MLCCAALYCTVYPPMCMPLRCPVWIQSTPIYSAIYVVKSQWFSSTCKHRLIMKSLISWRSHVFYFHRFPEKMARYCVAEVALALKYLHEHGVVHRYMRTPRTTAFLFFLLFLPSVSQTFHALYCATVFSKMFLWPLRWPYLYYGSTSLFQSYPDDYPVQKIELHYCLTLILHSLSNFFIPISHLVRPF